MKKEFLSKSGLIIYDEELKQYLEERFGDDISEALSDVNGGDPVYVWIGTKKQYNNLTEKIENCLYITTDDVENIEFENTTNKVTEINDNANDTTYPTTLAVKKVLSNISGYIKATDKSTVITNASTDDTVPSSLAVYKHTNNTVNAAKNTILQTVEDRVYGVEKTTNKVTKITEDAKHTTYPSSRAVFEAIKTYGGTDIETTDVIDENSTTEEVPNAAAVYSYIQAEMANINSIIQSQTSTVYYGTSEPDASMGKVGDIYVVVE